MSLDLNQALTVGRCSGFANHFMKLANKSFNATAPELDAINIALERCNAVFRELGDTARI
jgi:hypothetical protein